MVPNADAVLEELLKKDILDIFVIGNVSEANIRKIINDKTYEIPQHGFAKDMEFELIKEIEKEKIYMTKK